MNSIPTAGVSAVAPTPLSSRLDYLDATRAFALILGVVFHASLSFSPMFMGWAVQDISTSPVVTVFFTICHTFRMELFFLIAGFFGHVTFHRSGASAFVKSRLIRLGIPFVLGWLILRPLLVSGWIMGSASLRGDYDFWAGIQAGFQTLRTLPAGLFTGSHLWFLYYLCLITALMLVAWTFLTKLLSPAAQVRIDNVVSWLSRSTWSLPLVVIPTAAALWFMRRWGMDTPDQSLRPELPVLAVYGAFFATGWLFARRPETLTSFARGSWIQGVIAVVSLATIVALNGVQRDPAHPHSLAAHIVFTVAYASSMWTLVPLTLMVFRKLFVEPSGWVRYLADSSYWMYLVHLPLVVWLQVAVSEWPLHWSFKLGFVSIVTVLVSVITYDLFVRSTWIGSILNGRRKDRASSQWFRSRGAAPSLRLDPTNG